MFFKLKKKCFLRVLKEGQIEILSIYYNAFESFITWRDTPGGEDILDQSKGSAGTVQEDQTFLENFCL